MLVLWMVILTFALELSEPQFWTKSTILEEKGHIRYDLALVQLSGIWNYVLCSFGGKENFLNFILESRGPEKLLWFHSRTWTMKCMQKPFGQS